MLGTTMPTKTSKATQTRMAVRETVGTRNLEGVVEYDHYDENVHEQVSNRHLDLIIVFFIESTRLSRRSAIARMDLESEHNQ